MYQVNINLHSRVPNTKTAFLAQLSPQQHFLPISANLILHLIVCDLRPPDQKLLFSIFFLFFLFPDQTPISTSNCSPTVKNRNPNSCQLSLNSLFDLHTCDLVQLALLFTEKWQFERAGKTEKWRLQMFRFLVRTLQRKGKKQR